MSFTLTQPREGPHAHPPLVSYGELSVGDRDATAGTPMGSIPHAYCASQQICLSPVKMRF